VQEFRGEAVRIQPDRKYPVLLADPRRPQGFWGHSWTYRWNAAGVRRRRLRVVMPQSAAAPPATGRSSSTRSTATGAARAFDDIMAVADYIVTDMPYADSQPHDGGRRILRRAT